MKKYSAMALALLTTGLFIGTAQADTSITAYGTYWEGDDVGKGGGLRLKKTFLAFGAIEGRGGYVDFSDTSTEVIPLDISLNVRLPFFISPYAGVGAGYYLIDSSGRSSSDESGYLAQVGVEATFVLVGVMAEIRYHDIEGSYLDGTSVNAGILIKW